MPIVHYPAIVEPAGDGGYGVFFPDLPGCTSGGDTLQAAASAAEEGLRLYIRDMIEDKEALPEPSVLDAIEIDPDVTVAAVVLVRAETPGRAVRVNVSFDEGLLAAIDTTAKSCNMNRSAFLAFAANDCITRHARRDERRQVSEAAGYKVVGNHQDVSRYAIIGPGKLPGGTASATSSITPAEIDHLRPDSKVVGPRARRGDASKRT